MAQFFLHEMHPQKKKRTAFFELRTSKNKTETERTNFHYEI